MNFIQEYISITLSIVSTFLYLQLLLFIFKTVYENWMYLLYVSLYYISLRVVIYHWNMEETSCVWMIYDFT
jgi:hypothetical protein